MSSQSYTLRPWYICAGEHPRKGSLKGQYEQEGRSQHQCHIEKVMPFNCSQCADQGNPFSTSASVSALLVRQLKRFLFSLFSKCEFTHLHSSFVRTARRTKQAMVWCLSDWEYLWTAQHWGTCQIFIVIGCNIRRSSHSWKSKRENEGWMQHPSAWDYSKLPTQLREIFLQTSLVVIKPLQPKKRFLSFLSPWWENILYISSDYVNWLYCNNHLILCNVRL